MTFLGPEGREQLKTAARVGAIGIEMGLSVLVGHFGGRALDGLLGTGTVLGWVGLGVGLLAGFKSLFYVVRRVRADLEAQDAAARDLLKGDADRGAAVRRLVAREQAGQ